MLDLYLYTHFFIRKKLIRTLGSNAQNLKKIVRKSHISYFQILVFILAKNGYFVVIAFNMLKMESKFKYTVSIMKV